MCQCKDFPRILYARTLRPNQVKITKEETNREESEFKITVMSKRSRTSLRCSTCQCFQCADKNNLPTGTIIHKRLKASTAGLGTLKLKQVSDDAPY